MKTQCHFCSSLTLLIFLMCMSFDLRAQIETLKPIYTKIINNLDSKSTNVGIHPVFDKPIFMGYDSASGGIIFVIKSSLKGKNDIYIFDQNTFDFKKKFLTDNDSDFSLINNQIVITDNENIKFIDFITDQVNVQGYRKLLNYFPFQNYYLIGNFRSNLLSLVNMQFHNSILNVDIPKGENTGFAIDNAGKYFFVINEGLHIYNTDNKSQLLLPATTSTYNIGKVIGEILLQSLTSSMSLGIGIRSLPRVTLTYNIPLSKNNTLYGYHSIPLIQDNMLYWFASDKAYKVDLISSEILWEKKIAFEDHGLSETKLVGKTIHQVNLGYVLHPGGKTPHAIASHRIYDAETGRTLKDFKLSKNSSDLIQHYFYRNDSTLIIFYKDRIDMASLYSEKIKTIKVYDERKDGIFQNMQQNHVFVKVNKKDDNLVYLPASEDTVRTMCSKILTSFNRLDLKATILPFHSIHNIVGILPDFYVLHDEYYTVISKLGKIIHEFKANQYYGVINNRIYYYDNYTLYSIDPNEL